jgi:GNAT superfamily N-acetyltransferase
MGPDEARADAFARWYDELVCTRIEPWRFGTQFLDEDFPTVSDTNYLRIEAIPEGTPTRVVVEAADKALAETGSPPRIIIGSIALADRLAGALEAAGWSMHRYLLLTHDHDAAPMSRNHLHVEETTLAAFLRFRSTFGGMSASREYLEKVERLVGTRYFTATIHGRPASGCVLWAHDDEAQIDAVATAPEMRGRGAGAAAVAAAVRAADAAWIHLYTEAAAGPLPFYKSLGFEVAGAIAECTPGD